MLFILHTRRSLIGFYLIYNLQCKQTENNPEKIQLSAVTYCANTDNTLFCTVFSCCFAVYSCRKEITSICKHQRPFGSRKSSENGIDTFRLFRRRRSLYVDIFVLCNLSPFCSSFTATAYAAMRSMTGSQ